MQPWKDDRRKNSRPARRMYIHQRADWPNWTFDAARILPTLARVRNNQGLFMGRMESLGFDQKRLTQLEAVTEEVIKTSAIEGEVLPPSQVRSSIARRLGMDIGGAPISDRRVDGVVAMMLDATTRANQPLTAERIWTWHGGLFPTGWNEQGQITVGDWRTDAEGPMEVVSGQNAGGTRTVHYVAPAAARVPGEMALFLDWYNTYSTDYDPVLRAALAHLWFVTIHPMDDGNGRIARAICDGALSFADNSKQRYYSLSAQIHLEKEGYYDVLESTQTAANCDVTYWFQWFLNCMERAIQSATKTASGVLFKDAFWKVLPEGVYSDRHRKILELLLEGFVGNFTTTKWADIAKISQDSATRDINYLIQQELLIKAKGSGRSTSYLLRVDHVSGHEAWLKQMGRNDEIINEDAFVGDMEE